MSAQSSNLVPKMNTGQHKTVADFVRAQEPGTKFSFDGERDSGRSRLCMHPPAPGVMADCVDIAMEAKELFATMQRLSFFCQLPLDPAKTHITCEKIPS